MSRLLDDYQLDCFSRLSVLTEILHHFEREFYLQVPLALFVPFKFLLCDPRLLQVIEMHEYVRLVSLHDNKTIVLALVKEF